LQPAALHLPFTVPSAYASRHNLVLLLAPRMDNWGPGTCTLSVSRLYRRAIGVPDDLGLPMDLTARSFRIPSRPDRELSTEILFESVQSGSKGGALLHYWSTSPSSARRTGRAAPRCTQLASNNQSKSLTADLSIPRDDAAGDRPDRAVLRAALGRRQSPSPDRVFFCVRDRAGWDDARWALPLQCRPARSETAHGRGSPVAAHNCALSPNC